MSEENKKTISYTVVEVPTQSRVAIVDEENNEIGVEQAIASILESVKKLEKHLIG